MSLLVLEESEDDKGGKATRGGWNLDEDVLYGLETARYDRFMLR